MIYFAKKLEFTKRGRKYKNIPLYTKKGEMR